LQLVCNNLFNIMNKKLLSQNGHRLTKQRCSIFEALDLHPQSVAEIKDVLEKKEETVDKTTIYRTLEYFSQLNLINKTHFNGVTAQYELASPDHHHHLICNNCGSVEDVPLNEKLLLAQVKRKSNFEVKNHSLEFFGLCPNCQ